MPISPRSWAALLKRILGFQTSLLTLLGPHQPPLLLKPQMLMLMISLRAMMKFSPSALSRIVLNKCTSIQPTCGSLESLVVSCSFRPLSRQNMSSPVQSCPRKKIGVYRFFVQSVLSSGVYIQLVYSSLTSRAQVTQTSPHLSAVDQPDATARISSSELPTGRSHGRAH